MSRTRLTAAALLLAATTLLSCAPRIVPYTQAPPMSFDPRGLIAPNDPSVQSALKAILSDNTDVRTDFRRIQDWVALSLVYDPNTSERWQLPSETLSTRRGDCKDYSTLLCSLWRADGVPASDVYVAIGQGRATALHAFLIEKYLNGKWHVVEPQVGGFITSDLSAIETAENYVITYLFNDSVYGYSASWISATIHGSGTSPSPSVVARPPPVVRSFTAEPDAIYPGDRATLSWLVEGATYVGIDEGVGGVDPTGTVAVSPRESTLYKLVASNAGGSVTENVTVKVYNAVATRSGQLSPAAAQLVQPPFSIGFAGWYNGEDAVEVARAGQKLSATMNLRGGSPGQCILRIWRSAEGGHDEVVAQWGFKYDGSEDTEQISFAPSYAVGEAGTQGYYLDLLKDGAQAWVMPDAYPPRLTVAPKTGIGALAVGFAGWRVGADNVYAVRKGEAVTAAITLSGGDPGDYTLDVKRDRQGLSDETSQQLTFHYDGSSAVQGLIFVPSYAAGEDSTRGYYLDLYKDGKFLWSLAGNYPPRLTVTK